MQRLPQIGWVIVCLSLTAPAVARADAVSVMSAVYETSFFQSPAEPEEAASTSNFLSIFSWCHRCVAPDFAPHHADALTQSAAPTSNTGGFSVGSGIGVTFGGSMILPIPGLSSATPPDSNSNTPTITVPIAPGHDDDHHDGGAPSGGSIIGQGLGGSPHGGDHAGDHLISGVATTGRAALVKAEALAATPEPTTLLLLGTGLIALAGSGTWRRRV